MGRTLPVTVERLAHDVARDEGHVGGPLGETTHAIRLPLGAERDVDAYAVTVLHGLFLEVAAYAVEHLELETVGSDLLLLRETLRLVDHRRIMRGDAGIIPLEHQLPHA